MRPITWGICIFLSTLTLSVGGELLAIWFLRSQNIPRKAFLVNRLPAFSFIDKSELYPYVDPFLGHAANEPFTKLGEDWEKATYTLIALGGSTTASYLDFINWPDRLAKLGKEKGVSLSVYNGGIGAYSSNQHLLKLLRDALPLKPKIVISYDGSNDFGHSSLAEHPLHSAFQKRVFENVLEPPSFLLPNLAFVGRLFSNKLTNTTPAQVRYGTASKLTPVENWVNNHKLMNALATASNIKHLAFLQPTLGVGNYIPAEKEKNDFEQMDWGIPYSKIVKDFYVEAKKACAQMSYCVDLTHIFDGKTGLYNDPRHPNDQGTQIITESIFQELIKRKFLSPKT